MKQNNIKLMENLVQKVEEWKITKDKKDMENYFRRIFVADIYFDRWLDRFLTRMLDLILEDDFDSDEFMEINRKYPESQFHAYIISKKANDRIRNMKNENIKHNRNNVIEFPTRTTQNIIQDLIEVDKNHKIEELTEDFKDYNDYTEEEIDKMYKEFWEDAEWVEEFYNAPW